MTENCIFIPYCHIPLYGRVVVTGYKRKRGMLFDRVSMMNSQAVRTDNHNRVRRRTPRNARVSSPRVPAKTTDTAARERGVHTHACHNIVHADIYKYTYRLHSYNLLYQTSVNHHTNSRILVKKNLQTSDSVVDYILQSYWLYSVLSI